MAPGQCEIRGVRATSSGLLSLPFYCRPFIVSSLGHGAGALSGTRDRKASPPNVKPSCAAAATPRAVARLENMSGATRLIALRSLSLLFATLAIVCCSNEDEPALGARDPDGAALAADAAAPSDGASIDGLQSVSQPADGAVGSDASTPTMDAAPSDAGSPPADAPSSDAAVVTSGPLPLPPAGAGSSVQMLGSAGYSHLANIVLLAADEIKNTGASTSPQLRLELWLTTAPYASSGAGYSPAKHALGTLAAGASVLKVSSGALPWIEPPPGPYYVAIVLTQFTGAAVNDGYSHVTHFVFPDLYTES